MTTLIDRRGPSRRALLAGFSATGALMISGLAVINPREAWGLEVTNLKPETMRTLIIMARDVYPHDRIADKFYAIAMKPYETKAATDAADSRWFPISKVPKLAFDHADILATALDRLKGKVRYQPIGFELLPPKFTLSQLQHLYEVVLGAALDKRNFRKKVLGFGLLVPLKETQMTGRHRPAQLFEFDAVKYEKLKKKGFNFEL